MALPKKKTRHVGTSANCIPDKPGVRYFQVTFQLFVQFSKSSYSLATVTHRLKPPQNWTSVQIHSGYRVHLTSKLSVRLLVHSAHVFQIQQEQKLHSQTNEKLGPRGSLKCKASLTARI